MAQEKKVALITGANRGLGFETAKQLAQKGVVVVLGARKLADAEAAVAKLTAEDPEGVIEAYGIQLDVTSAADRTAVARYIDQQFGKLDILINNAGIGPKDGLMVKRTVETTEEEFQTVFQTNFFAMVFITRELLPLLKKSDAGRIVNLSSILGSLTLQADPADPLVVKSLAYDASKTAINAFTIHLASELKGTKIKVNSAHPGWVKTEMGSDAAPMEIPEGAKTSVELALLGPDGPNGRFIHLGKELPW